jgi:hypothetical protein
MSNTDNLPAKRNGFDDSNDDSIWRGPRIRFNEGTHRQQDETVIATDAEYVATDTTAIVSCFVNKELRDQIVEKPGEELDVNMMNAQIPREEWGIGLNGQPQEPWQRQQLVYLLREHDASENTFVTSSGGGHVAVRELKKRVRRMRQLRGAEVYPVITLGSAPWKTKYGMRTRPHFEIVRWITFSGPKAPAQIEQAKPSDSKPAAATAGKTATVEKKGKVREVKPPSLAAEMDDEIPF